MSDGESEDEYRAVDNTEDENVGHSFNSGEITAAIMPMLTKFSTTGSPFFDKNRCIPVVSLGSGRMAKIAGSSDTGAGIVFMSKDEFSDFLNVCNNSVAVQRKCVYPTGYNCVENRPFQHIGLVQPKFMASGAYLDIDIPMTMNVDNIFSKPIGSDDEYIEGAESLSDAATEVGVLYCQEWLNCLEDTVREEYEARKAEHDKQVDLEDGENSEYESDSDEQINDAGVMDDMVDESKKEATVDTSSSRIKDIEKIEAWTFVRHNTLGGKTGVHIYIPRLHCWPKRKMDAYRRTLEAMSGNKELVFDTISKIHGVDKESLKDDPLKIFDGCPFQGTALLPYNTKIGGVMYELVAKHRLGRDPDGNIIMNAIDESEYQEELERLDLNDCNIYSDPYVVLDKSDPEAQLKISRRDVATVSSRELVQAYLRTGHLNSHSVANLLAVLDVIPVEYFEKAGCAESHHHRSLIISVIKNTVWDDSIENNNERLRFAIVEIVFRRDKKTVDMYAKNWSAYLTKRIRSVVSSTKSLADLIDNVKRWAPEGSNLSLDTMFCRETAESIVLSELRGDDFHVSKRFIQRVAFSVFGERVVAVKISKTDYEVRFRTSNNPSDYLTNLMFGDISQRDVSLPLNQWVLVPEFATSMATLFGDTVYDYINAKRREIRNRIASIFKRYNLHLAPESKVKTKTIERLLDKLPTIYKGKPDQLSAHKALLEKCIDDIYKQNNLGFVCQKLRGDGASSVGVTLSVLGALARRPFRKDTDTSLIGFVNGVYRFNKDMCAAGERVAFKKLSDNTHHTVTTCASVPLRPDKHRKGEFYYDYVVDHVKEIFDHESYKEIDAKLLEEQGVKDVEAHMRDEKKYCDPFVWVMYLLASYIYSWTPPTKCLTLQGSGSDGKTCVLNLFDQTYGPSKTCDGMSPGFVGQVSAGALSHQVTDGTHHSGGLMVLENARVTFAQDPSAKNPYLNDNVIKSILSQSLMPLREVGGKAMLVKVRTGIVVLTNVPVNVGQANAGNVRRHYRYMMLNKFGDASLRATNAAAKFADPKVASFFQNNKLVAEAFAVYQAELFTDMIRKYGSFENVPVPPSVMKYTEEMFFESDPVYKYERKYLKPNVKTRGSESISLNEISRRFAAWFRSNNPNNKSDEYVAQLGRLLKTRIVESHGNCKDRKSRGKYFLEILEDQEEEEEDLEEERIPASKHARNLRMKCAVRSAELSISGLDSQKQ